MGEVFYHYEKFTVKISLFYTLKSTLNDHLSLSAPPLKQQNHNKSNEKTNPHVEGQRLFIDICINNNFQYNITFFITIKSFVLIILTYTPIIFTNNSIIVLTIM